MSLLSRLFGGRSRSGGAAPDHEPVDYNGFAIRPEPIREGGQWRIAARIEREVAGEMKSHHLVRADMMADAEAAAAESVRKAKRLIDERGEGVFDRPR